MQFPAPTDLVIAEEITEAAEENVAVVLSVPAVMAQSAEVLQKMTAEKAANAEMQKAAEKITDAEVQRAVEKVTLAEIRRVAEEKKAAEIWKVAKKAANVEMWKVVARAEEQDVAARMAMSVAGNLQTGHVLKETTRNN